MVYLLKYFQSKFLLLNIVLKLFSGNFFRERETYYNLDSYHLTLPHTNYTSL